MDAVFEKSFTILMVVKFGSSNIPMHVSDSEGTLEFLYPREFDEGSRVYISPTGALIHFESIKRNSIRICNFELGWKVTKVNMFHNGNLCGGFYILRNTIMGEGKSFMQVPFCNL